MHLLLLFLCAVFADTQRVTPPLAISTPSLPSLNGACILSSNGSVQMSLCFGAERPIGCYSAIDPFGSSFALDDYSRFDYIGYSIVLLWINNVNQVEFVADSYCKLACWTQNISSWTCFIKSIEAPFWNSSLIGCLSGLCFLNKPCNQCLLWQGDVQPPAFVPIAPNVTTPPSISAPDPPADKSDLPEIDDNMMIMIIIIMLMLCIMICCCLLCCLLAFASRRKKRDKEKIKEIKEDKFVRGHADVNVNVIAPRIQKTPLPARPDATLPLKRYSDVSYTESETTFMSSSGDDYGHLELSDYYRDGPPSPPTVPS